MAPPVTPTTSPAPAPGGEGGARAMADGRGVTPASEPEQIGYINAHGTSTSAQRQGRDSGSQARPSARPRLSAGHQLHQVHDGPPAGGQRCHRGGGHGDGPAGRLSCRPPSIISTPDPECDLDIVPNQGRERQMEYAMSNSLGFGGHNASLMLRKYEEE